MFKLVVLCVFAAAVAEPDPALLYSSSLAYSSYPAILPATTSHLIAQPSPIVYSSPLAYSHFIKKRSADAEPEPEAKPEPEPEAKADPQLIYSSSLGYPNTLTTPVITNPFIPYSYSYPYETALPWGAHLIKKRSAQFLTPTTYVPSTYALPSYSHYPTTYLGNQYYSGALDNTVLVNQHLIKKRSASAVLPYTSYASPYAVPSYYNNIYPALPTTYIGSNYYPTAALNGVVGLHAIKKRSAQLLTPGLIAPTTYAASPYYTSTYAASSPLVSSYPYVASPYAYSTYIKK